MAHYAADCWDAEIELSYGWIECVGIANRTDFDLTRHSLYSKVKLQTARRLPETKTITRTTIVLEKGKIGSALKKDGSALITFIENLEENEKNQLKEHFETNNEKELDVNGKVMLLKKDMIKKIDVE